MSEVKMDMSEYEAIMETKRLLQESLENQKELQDKIERLQVEKIKALEDAKMMVVKKTTINVYHHLYKRNKDLGRSIENMLIALGVDTNNIRIYDRYSMYANSVDEGTLNTIIDNLFKFEKQAEPEQTSITTHGLDEVKEELRKEYYAEQDADVVEKLSERERLLIQMNELRKDNDSLTSRNFVLDMSNKSYLEKIEGLEQSINEKTEELKNTSKELKVLRDDYDIIKVKYSDMSNRNKDIESRLLKVDVKQKVSWFGKFIAALRHE